MVLINNKKENPIKKNLPMILFILIFVSSIAFFVNSNNVKEQEKYKLYTAFAQLDNAFGTVMLNKGDVAFWGQSANAVVDEINRFLSIDLKCNSSKESQCENMPSQVQNSSFILKNGVGIGIEIKNPYCTDISILNKQEKCGNAYIDLHPVKRSSSEIYELEITNGGILAPASFDGKKY